MIKAIILLGRGLLAQFAGGDSRDRGQFGQRLQQGLNPRGSTRIVVAGDSIFLGNYYIEDVADRDFLDSTINWLLDRNALVSGIAPQKVTEYRLLMTEARQRQSRWLLLGALPGSILLFGGLVWLLRRK